MVTNKSNTYIKRTRSKVKVKNKDIRIERRKRMGLKTPQTNTPPIILPVPYKELNEKTSESKEEIKNDLLKNTSKNRKLILTKDEINKLNDIIESKKLPQRLINRAEILLLYYKGFNVTEISNQVKVSHPTVRLWINNALKDGLNDENMFKETARDKIKVNKHEELYRIYMTLTEEEKRWINSLFRFIPIDGNVRDLRVDAHYMEKDDSDIRIIANHIKRYSSDKGFSNLSNLPLEKIHQLLMNFSIYIMMSPPKFTDHVFEISQTNYNKNRVERVETARDKIKVDKENISTDPENHIILTKEQREWIINLFPYNYTNDTDYENFRMIADHIKRHASDKGFSNLSNLSIGRIYNLLRNMSIARIIPYGGYLPDYKVDKFRDQVTLANQYIIDNNLNPGHYNVLTREEKEWIISLFPSDGDFKDLMTVADYIKQNAPEKGFSNLSNLSSETICQLLIRMYASRLIPPLFEIKQKKTFLKRIFAVAKKFLQCDCCKKR